MVSLQSEKDILKEKVNTCDDFVSFLKEKEDDIKANVYELIIDFKGLLRKKPPNFTDKERNRYIQQGYKCKYKTPEEEYNNYTKYQYKECSKCEERKLLEEYDTNASGIDCFDKNGYRRYRPECKICYKKTSKSGNEAKKIAKNLDIPYEAPKGTLCAICNKPGKKGNKLVFDHDHKTCRFRGYLHNSCNRSLGVLGDNTEELLRALNYLIKSDPKKIVQDPKTFKIKIQQDPIDSLRIDKISLD
tara:strand:+ start:91 stop:825 length:735 start_codon:yes stop_codon:yes gene_type:complete